jgi:hypothetical protein
MTTTITVSLRYGYCMPSLSAFKARLHDASLLARVTTRGCECRRFMQVIESSKGWTLKRVATSIILLVWYVRLCAHPRYLSRVSKLSSCIRGFTKKCNLFFAVYCYWRFTVFRNRKLRTQGFRGVQPLEGSCGKWQMCSILLHCRKALPLLSVSVSRQ